MVIWINSHDNEKIEQRQNKPVPVCTYEWLEVFKIYPNKDSPFWGGKHPYTGIEPNFVTKFYSYTGFWQKLYNS